MEKIAQAAAQVADLQVSLKEEQIIVEEKKGQTDKLIVEIGKEKAVVDEAVEAGREVSTQQTHHTLNETLCLEWNGRPITAVLCA